MRSSKKYELMKVSFFLHEHYYKVVIKITWKFHEILSISELRNRECDPIYDLFRNKNMSVWYDIYFDICAGCVQFVFLLNLYLTHHIVIWGYSTRFVAFHVFFIPPQTKCPSDCLSVWLPSVDIILSMHYRGNRCIDFSENVYTNYLSSEDVHLEFWYWLHNFLQLTTLYLL